MKLSLPNVAKRSKNNRVAQEISLAQICADVMQNCENAIIDKLAVGLEIFEGDAVLRNDCLRAKLFQMLAQIKAARR